jgi:hypothetical protein
MLDKTMLRFKTWFLQEENNTGVITSGPNPTQDKQQLGKLVQQVSMDPKVAQAAVNVGPNNPRKTQQDTLKAVQQSMQSQPNKGNANPNANITAFDVTNQILKQAGGNVPQLGATAGFTNRN